MTASDKVLVATLVALAAGSGAAYAERLAPYPDALRPSTWFGAPPAAAQPGVRVGEVADYPSLGAVPRIAHPLTRAEVQSDVELARRSRTLRTTGDHPVSRVAAQQRTDPPSRAQVQADLERARRDGALLSSTGDAAAYPAAPQYAGARIQGAAQAEYEQEQAPRGAAAASTRLGDSQVEPRGSTGPM